MASTEECNAFFMLDNCTIEIFEKHRGELLTLQIIGVILSFFLCVLPQALNLFQYWKGSFRHIRSGKISKAISDSRFASNVCGILNGIFLMLAFSLGLGLRSKNFIAAILSLGLQISFGYACLNFCLVAISKMQRFTDDGKLSNKAAFVSSFHFAFLLMTSLVSLAATDNLHPNNFDLIIAITSIPALLWLAYNTKAHAEAGLVFVAQENKVATMATNAAFRSNKQLHLRENVENRMRKTLNYTWFSIGVALVSVIISLATRGVLETQILSIAGITVTGMLANACSWFLFRKHNIEKKKLPEGSKLASIAQSQAETQVKSLKRIERLSLLPGSRQNLNV